MRNDTLFSPSPGTPGEGWGGGSSDSELPVHPPNPLPALPRITGGGKVAAQCAFLLALLVAGCCHCPPPPTAKPPYFGPTLSIAEVVRAVNANNEKIPSLWSNQQFHAELPDEKGHLHIFDGDGVLLCLKPSDLYLRGDILGIGEAFSLGTTAERYWLKVVPELDTLWTGTYANIDRADASQLPIRPDLLLEVLGISDIDTNLMQPPVPVMRYSNDQDAYVMVWSSPSPTHWIAQREIWYDRKTLLPERVYLYDANGRAVVQALLSDPQPVPADQDAEAKPDSPKIATVYQLYFPDSKTRLNLSLFNMCLTNKRVPSVKTFDKLVSNLDNPGVNHVNDLDRGPRGGK